jgi:uncharacterized alpha-E superfamily protein
LPSLLARFASNVYWLGRYLERAENLARILDINETYARGGATGPDWQRVLDLYADTPRFFERNQTADAASVLNFYVIDLANPTSIAATVRMARENARSLRHLISTEMWTHLNIFHNRVARLNQRDLRLSNVSNVCEDIKEACQTFEGIAEGTFFHGEPWCFYQIGKYIERADQTTRILDIGFGRIAEDTQDTLETVHWNVLLRSVAGYHAFRGLYPAGSQPRDIATFLLYDEEFPRAVGLCVERLSVRLGELETRHGHARHAAVEDARRNLVFSLTTGPGGHITPRNLHKYLDSLQISLGTVSTSLTLAFFAGN